MNHEVSFVQSLIKEYPKAPNILTLPYSSDAEVLQVGSQFLFLSQDTVAEEITLGLIRHPASLGWLTVISSLSDLAASGVTTDSVSVLLGHPDLHANKFDSEFISLFRKGVDEAVCEFAIQLEEFRTFASTVPIATCTAMSLRSEPKRVSRIGLKEGDTIYSTGLLGWGNAVGLYNVLAPQLGKKNAEEADRLYRPTPRVKESLFIRDWATSCIDTSDGALFTLDLLSELNHCEIEFKFDPHLMHPLTHHLSKITKLPLWLFFAGQNGEFELFFSIAKDKLTEFSNACAKAGVSFNSIGKVNRGKGLSFVTENRKFPLDLQPIQNMLYEGKSPEQYVQGLLSFYQQNLSKGLDYGVDTNW